MRAKTYRLVYQAQEDVPIITVYATGPSAETALELAQSSFKVLRAYVARLDHEADAAAKRAKAQKSADTTDSVGA